MHSLQSSLRLRNDRLSSQAICTALQLSNFGTTIIQSHSQNPQRQNLYRWPYFCVSGLATYLHFPRRVLPGILNYQVLTVFSKEFPNKLNDAEFIRNMRHERTDRKSTTSCVDVDCAGVSLAPSPGRSVLCLPIKEDSAHKQWKSPKQPFEPNVCSDLETSDM